MNEYGEILEKIFSEPKFWGLGITPNDCLFLHVDGYNKELISISNYLQNFNWHNSDLPDIPIEYRKYLRYLLKQTQQKLLKNSCEKNYEPLKRLLTSGNKVWLASRDDNE